MGVKDGDRKRVIKVSLFFMICIFFGINYVIFCLKELSVKILEGNNLGVFLWLYYLVMSCLYEFIIMFIL